MDNNTLLIFNGDHAYNCRKQTFPAEDSCTLVWRENYLEGPLPCGIPFDEFERIRAEFLHSCVPEYSEEQIYRALINHHTVLEKFKTPSCRIVLYFDCCMYDMIMLARIFHLLQKTQAEIRLFCEDAILGCSPEVFRKDIASLRTVPQKIAELYAYAWECVLQGPESIAQFNRNNSAKAEPFLAEAMLRYGEDHPADGGIGRSQKQLLEIISSGTHTFPEIFQAFDKYEKYMFLGDTHCLRLLDGLAAQSLIRKTAPQQAEKYPSYLPN